MRLALMFFLIPFVLSVLSLFVISDMFTPTFNMGDFRAQYTGAFIANIGDVQDLYNLDSQHRAQKTFLPTIQKAQILPFYSPPVIAILMSPLGAYPYPVSYLIFGFVQLFFLIISIIVLAFSLQSIRNKPAGNQAVCRWDILLLPAGYVMIWIGILHGQLSAIWMCVAAISWFLYQKGRHISSGLIISLLFLKLHLIVLPLIFFIIAKKWRVSGGILLGVSIISLISLNVLGVDGVRHYVSFLLELSQLERTHGVNASQQPTLFGFIAFITQGRFESMSPTLSRFVFPVWIPLTLVSVSYLIFRWYKIPNTSVQIMKLKYVQLLAAMLFLSPHTHSYDLSIFFVGLVLFIDYKLIDRNYLKKKYDKINVRYIKLFIVFAITATTLIISLLPSSGLIIFGTIFFLIEKEYGKILKSPRHD